MTVHKVLLLVLTMISLLVVFAIPVTSKPSDSIVVNGADAIRQISVDVNQDLVDSISGVGSRVVMEVAGTTRYESLTAIPSALGTLLIQIPDRITFQFSNRSRKMQLAYPTAFFNDSTPPQISNVTAEEGSGIIAWTTDEFASSTVLYGIQTGVYTSTVSEPLYVKQHEVTLPGLTSGTTYYYKTRSSDRSGNMTTSSEYSFTAQVSVYLPIIIRSQ